MSTTRGEPQCAYADSIHTLIAHPLLMNILTISGLPELVAIEAAPPTAER